MFISFKQFASLLRRCVLACSLAAASSLASAGVISVSLDTSDFGTTSGYLDFQWSASAGVPLATAKITDLVGFNPSGYVDAFGVSAIPGGYLFRNDTLNDLFHAAYFGDIVSFKLTFDGEVDPSTSYVSHFVVSAFDDSFQPLGNYDPVTGALADFSWTPPTVAGQDGLLAVQISDPNVTLVPEPGGVALFGVGLAALAIGARRRSACGTSSKTAG